MKILFAASEGVPFYKTGGLADVVGGLSKALKKKRHDVRVILPKYKVIQSPKFSLKETGPELLIPMGDRVELGALRTGRIGPHIPAYFVQQDKYFGRDELYRDSEGDYPDNDERFIFFSRAVVEVCKVANFKPDVIHCHDWQTGLIPAYLKTLYRLDHFFRETSTVFTIHNMAYQGIFTREALFLAGFGWREFSMDRLEFYGQINFLKAGIVYADGLTTVSPTYAKQIQSSPDYGCGLEGVLASRSSDLVGILNGLDYAEWNPAKDSFIVRPFGAGNLKGKRDCKADLQKTVGLPVSPEVPLLGMVSRLDSQKGFDKLIPLVNWLMRQGVQLISLGQGEASIMTQLQEEMQHYPRQISARFEYDEPRAHKIYAGCDMFLMPSRFEPCGLGQMIAMRYGAVPIVCLTGGLADTVEPFDPVRGCGNGFGFRDYGTEELQGALEEALRIWNQPALWTKVQANAFASDFSWASSADAYLNLYRQALARTRRS